MFLDVTVMLLGMTTYTPNELERLGHEVAAERMERRWGKEAAARRAAISSITWKRVEDGLPVRETSYRSIEAAFGWPPGRIDDLARGRASGEAALNADDEQALTLLTREQVARFLLAAERKNEGTHSDADERAIQDFIAHERASAAIRPGPDLGKLVEVNNAAWGATNDRMFELIKHPDVSNEDRIALLEQGIESSSVYSDFLIMAAYESMDTRARDILPSVFAMRSKMEEIRQALLEEGHANVTNLADRRPVPPPPDLDDLDVAASRREKQSDGERDDDE
ncbi:hypothetical protein D2E36_01665 [Mycobacteroides abscessus]|uniref:hypothetical protein n=1 Tax=Mycobacteroides abscessus TaxID=36809 RepID=UPI000C25FF29|nr:hypothetical protein [Mycobacteroides abscessus]RIR35618.1 hypothetical protein D2E38_12115 [Mycobacteroides abscessus]RIR46140.1 hypothetical protein D2E36_01665 [Mycobacteroides abscessus]RIS38554.1 hypothetical protein D2E60_21765 [Mycobacteroides abscessus]